MRSFLRSKIHNATVTEANIHYVGSITIDEDLMEKADLAEWERVLVVSNTNGARLETYVIKGARGSGVIGINGGAAHLIQRDHQVIVMSFHFAERAQKPKCILVDAKNRFVKYLTELGGSEVC